MQYLMHAGVLTLPQSTRPLAQVRSAYWGPKKQIQVPGSSETFQADIQLGDDRSGDVRRKAYTLTDGSGTLRMEAHPTYALGEDPDLVGWPVCRVPRVDHADIDLNGDHYTLTMHNSQNYSLDDSQGHQMLQVMHQGISGGWVMDAERPFSTEVLCGLFAFCRYLEQENEFLVV